MRKTLIALALIVSTFAFAFSTGHIPAAHASGCVGGGTHWSQVTTSGWNNQGSLHVKSDVSLWLDDFDDYCGRVMYTGDFEQTSGGSTNVWSDDLGYARGVTVVNNTDNNTYDSGEVFGRGFWVNVASGTCTVSGEARIGWSSASWYSAHTVSVCV